jgi:hypothetical protein
MKISMTNTEIQLAQNCPDQRETRFIGVRISGGPLYQVSHQYRTTGNKLLKATHFQALSSSGCINKSINQSITHTHNTHICIYVCMYIYIHTYTHTHTHTHTTARTPCGGISSSQCPYLQRATCRYTKHGHASNTR